MRTAVIYHEFFHINHPPLINVKAPHQGTAAKTTVPAPRLYLRPCKLVSIRIHPVLKHRPSSWVFILIRFPMNLKNLHNGLFDNEYDLFKSQLPLHQIWKIMMIFSQGSARSSALTAARLPHTCCQPFAWFLRHAVFFSSSQDISLFSSLLLFILSSMLPPVSLL